MDFSKLGTALYQPKTFIYSTTEVSDRFLDTMEDLICTDYLTPTQEDTLLDVLEGLGERKYTAIPDMSAEDRKEFRSIVAQAERLCGCKHHIQMLLSIDLPDLGLFSDTVLTIGKGSIKEPTPLLNYLFGESSNEFLVTRIALPKPLAEHLLEMFPKEVSKMTTLEGFLAYNSQKMNL